MNFKQYSPEELKECSMIEVVHSVLGDKRQATTFNELVQEIAQVLGLSQEQVNAKLAQFYTDLNIDGRFINLGENRWGLRSWYPYEQIDEEILPQPKPKKKR
ncbi:TPA: DNA-directed RNA polymerase subunit delta, partial [Bacillus mobilis]